MLKRFFRLTTALSLLLVLALPIATAYAAGASISLTANKATVPSGSSVIIAVYVNGGGTPLNAVQTDLNYPDSKLQYVGFSATGSAFEIGASSGGGNGLASLDRGTTSPVSGSALVGTVTFKALVGSGSAAISVAGSSNLVNANDNTAVPYGSSGVSVNFGAAAASSSAPPAATAPVAPKDTTPPVITAVKLKDITPFSATVTWTTNEASDSAVDFGVDTNYGLSTSSATLVTAHSVALNSAFLTPETLLHYRVKSTDAAGNVATGTDQTFQLPGVPITVVVRGANGKPQAGATVTLDGSTGTTNSSGSVVLPSSLGNKKITTTYQGVTVQKPITVAKSATPLPPVQLDLAKQPLNHWMLTSIGLLVVVLTLLAIDAILFGSRLLARLTGLRFRPKPAVHQALGASAATGVVTAPAPKPDPEPVTVTGEAEPAVAQSVDKLMGGHSPLVADTPEPETEPTPPAEPLKINLEPLPTAPLIAEPAASQAADVAERLKKTSPKPVHHKKKTTPKKIDVS